MTTNTQKNNFTQLEIRQVHNFFTQFYDTAHKKVVGRPPILKPPEIAVITLLQATYQIKSLKALYTLLTQKYTDIFPKLPAYQNFVISMNKNTLFLLRLLLLVLEAGKIYLSQIKFIDSTPLPVCKIYRSSNHKTMKLLSSKKKSTTGWFYGLKLHLICDEKYNLACFKLTTASLDDREVLNEFIEKIKDTNSILVADAGYLSKAYETKFWNTGAYFVTATRSNMKTLASLYQQKLMNMRSKVETVFSILKDRFRLVTSIPRSVNGYLAHYFRSIFSYVFSDLDKVLRIS
jgi:Transposase DDE domain